MIADAFLPEDGRAVCLAFEHKVYNQKNRGQHDNPDERCHDVKQSFEEAFCLVHAVCYGSIQSGLLDHMLKCVCMDRLYIKNFILPFLLYEIAKKCKERWR